MSHALTEDEQAWFESLTHNRGNLALVRTMMKGEPVAVIVDVREEEDGGSDMAPIALLVNDAVLALLDPPLCQECGDPALPEPHE